MFSFVILLNQLRNIAMKRIITLFGAFALLTNLNSFSYAQALEDFKPSSVNQLGKAYPQVNSEEGTCPTLCTGSQKSTA